MPSRTIIGPPRVSAREASAIKASVPPSPLLSARSRNRTYLAVTTISSAQMMSDRMPRMTGSVAALLPPAASTDSRSA
jgi:hypothetical protein